MGKAKYSSISRRLGCTVCLKLNKTYRVWRGCLFMEGWTLFRNLGGFEKENLVMRRRDWGACGFWWELLGKREGEGKFHIFNENSMLALSTLVDAEGSRAARLHTTLWFLSARSRFYEDLWGFILTYTLGFRTAPFVARGYLQQHAPEIKSGFVFFTVCLTIGITYATGVLSVKR